MEYEDAPGGGGRQTVVDKATGGGAEVEYDGAGRVTKQTDPAETTTEYEYYADDSTSLTEPGGTLAAQTLLRP